MPLIRHLLRHEQAATAIEYGLVAALISLACIMAFMSLGLDLADIFTRAATAMTGAGAQPPPPAAEWV